MHYIWINSNLINAGVALVPNYERYNLTQLGTRQSLRTRLANQNLFGPNLPNKLKLEVLNIHERTPHGASCVREIFLGPLSEVTYYALASLTGNRPLIPG